LWKTPAELKDLSVSGAPGRKLSYFGYEFEVPWDDVDEQKTRVIGSLQLIAFRSGKAIMLSRVPPKRLVNGLLDEAMKRGTLTAWWIKWLYGDDTLESDYNFVHAALETTPSKITLLTPRPKAFRETTLLLYKSTFVLNSNSDIFFIQRKDFRGFQYGDPQSHERRIVDDLFADNGRLEFTFLSGKHNVGISQPEINRVIQSVRVAPQQGSNVDH